MAVVRVSIATAGSTPGVSAARLGRPRFRPSGNGLLGLAVTVAAPLALLGVVVTGGTPAATKGVAVLIAIFGVLLAAGNPGVALCALIVYLPLQQIGLAWFLRLGTPASIIRDLGGLKDVIALGLVVASLRAVKARPRALDLADGLALAYFGLVTLYLFAPSVVHGVFFPLSFYARLTAWRGDVLFIVIFLATRHVGLSDRARQWLVRVLLTIAVVAGGCALFEFFDSTGWNRFLVSTVHLPQYQATIFHVFLNPADVLVHGTIGGRDVIRAGSILLSPLEVGAYLTIGLSVALSRLAQERFRSRFLVVAVLAAAGVTVTVTRSAVLGVIVMMLALARAGVVNRAPGRIRLVLLVAAGAVAVAPFAGSSLVGQRSISGISGGQDSQEHLTAGIKGIETLVHSPLGLGLGTGAQTSQRYHLGTLVTENAYLQVGNELGIAAMAIFVLLTLTVLWKLGRSRGPSSGPVPTAAIFAAGCGLAVGAFFLQIWNDYSVTLTFWGLAGLALRPTFERSRRRQASGSPNLAAAARSTQPVLHAPGATG